MKIKTVLLFFIVSTLISCGTSFGKKLEFGNLEIFYSESVPVSYVEDLGIYFEENNLILDHPHSIKLTSDHDSFILKFILNTDYKALPTEMEDDYLRLESDLKEAVFSDVNFKLELCDVNFYPLNLKN